MKLRSLPVSRFTTTMARAPQAAIFPHGSVFKALAAIAFVKIANALPTQVVRPSHGKGG
jgi:hypothetical protein